MAAAVHIFLVANQVVVGFSLPEFSLTLQQFIRPGCTETLPAMQNLAQRKTRQRAHDRMNVVGHHHPGRQVEPDSCVKAQRVGQNLRDFRPL